MGTPPSDLLLLEEWFVLDKHVNWATNLLNNLGLQADIFCYRCLTKH